MKFSIASIVLEIVQKTTFNEIQVFNDTWAGVSHDPGTAMREQSTL